MKRVACTYMANSRFAFGNFLEYFSPNIFNPQLLECSVEPMDTEGHLFYFMYQIVN